MLTVADKVDTLFPRTIDKAGNLQLTSKYEWTSGFFPGNLWYAYEATGNDTLKQEAVKWTEKLASLQNFTEHHDLGFMLYCSYGNAYRLTGNEQYKAILVQAAKSLSTRFSTKTGTIKSWNTFKSWDGEKQYYYPVIIDNMMNLELLFFASKVTGNNYYKDIAIRHALSTMQNQVRDDYSCYHVVCYDSVTGKVLAKETAQGYANNSTWARGQSWGIYGFTMVYRETGDKRFLLTAKRMADYYINNPDLPVDKVPYWDFNANDSGYTPSRASYAKEIPVKYRDASAAAVTASALLELSTYLGENGRKYKDVAITILHSLSSSAYRAKMGENGDFILKHSVGSIAHDAEIDVPLVYADYYFLEALNRYQLLLDHKDPIKGYSLNK
ncbi:family 88 glycosyl hydrolase [Russula earlei]|uniref:Family 88 glycosyl hydrolase n=1 Tax=Russula earlei TaxID=71964 RepID=A0ACC0TRZ5_9AGAM|nr:family 88 glycosyl hydrolase [Russula earlei]